MSQLEPEPDAGPAICLDGVDPATIDGVDPATIDGVDPATIESLPVAEHAAAYSGLHARLQEALTSLDEL